jgi:hypothetical protein
MEQIMDITASLANAVQPFYTFSGFWLGAVMALLMYVNAIRTVLNPNGFSAYMGLPLKDAAGAAWVRVYGLRALFIGLVVTFFLVRLDPVSLTWLFVMAIPMALGDAYLVSSTGGKGTSRHLIITGVLVVAAFMMHQWQIAVVKP